jgi:hypothetical protein
VTCLVNQELVTRVEMSCTHGRPLIQDLQGWPVLAFIVRPRKKTPRLLDAPPRNGRPSSPGAWICYPNPMQERQSKVALINTCPHCERSSPPNNMATARTMSIRLIERRRPSLIPISIRNQPSENGLRGIIG